MGFLTQFGRWLKGREPVMTGAVVGVGTLTVGPEWIQAGAGVLGVDLDETQAKTIAGAITILIAFWSRARVTPPTPKG